MNDAYINLLPHEVAPHPANTAYARIKSAQLLKTLGEKLPEITSQVQFDKAAVFVMDSFPTQFGIRQRDPTRLPCPGWLEEDPEFRITVPSRDTFAAQLRAVNLGSTDVTSPVQQNLELLQNVLGLTSAEHKLLVLAYCLRRARPARLLHSLLAFNGDDKPNSFEMLGLLLDEPAQDIRWALDPECRLHGMGLLDIKLEHQDNQLLRYLCATQTLLDSLEIPHRSIAGLMARLSEPERNWLFETEEPVRPCVFLEMFPEAVAKAFEAAVYKQQLNAKHMAVLAEWFGTHTIDPKVCQPLEGRLDFQTIQQAVRRCYVANAVERRAVTQFNIYQALYAAAS